MKAGGDFKDGREGHRKGRKAGTWGEDRGKRVGGWEEE